MEVCHCDFSLLFMFGTGIVISFLRQVATTNLDLYDQALQMLFHSSSFSQQQDLVDTKELFRSRGLELTDSRFVDIMDSSVLLGHFEGALWLSSLVDPSAVLMADAFNLEVNDDVISAAASSLTPSE